MNRRQRTAWLAVLALCALPALAWAGGHAHFDVRQAQMPAEDARFMAALFELAERASLENAGVLGWFGSSGRRGTHYETYRERIDRIVEELERLETPPRLTGVSDLIVGAVKGQRMFFGEWYGAQRSGREFESQLTSQLGFHAGLDRSHRDLIRAYGELLALFPDESGTNRQSFFDTLCALDLI